MSLEKQLADYLNQPGFYRFVSAWIDKYKRLGHLGGKIYLDHLNSDEKESLGGLLGLDLSHGILELTYSKFQKRLFQTRYMDVDFLKTLEILNKEPLYSQKDLKEISDLLLEEAKKEVLCYFDNTKAYSWLMYYFNTDKYVKRYNSLFKEKYWVILKNVCHALNHLPIYDSQYELLAIFSQRITKDPHYFDEDLPRDLLLKGIIYSLHIDNHIDNSQKISEVLYEAGILKDDLSNYCYICHIKPQKEYLSWDGFYHLYEPWNANLCNINAVEGLFRQSAILIFENPSVFRALTPFIQEYHIDIGLISSNGQINICTYILLDRLVESGCQLYYTGDFDPEGLMIADKLKQRYRENMILWGYHQKWFDKVQIEQIDISTKRIQILKQIQSKELHSIARSIQENLSFGYQEGLIDEYKKEIMTSFKK